MRKVEVIYNDLGFISEYRCPYCGELLSEDDSYKDDVGTMFFTCPKCGETSSLAKSEERIRLEKSLEEQRRLTEKLRWNVQLSKVSLEPLWDEPLKTIHPAIDLLDGVAYVGVMMYWKERDDKGREKVKPVPTLITSKREVIPLISEYLKARGLQLRRQVNWLPNRWSIQSIKQFLDGKAEVDPKELYIAVKTVFEEYVEFEDETVYDFVALWTIGTYLFHVFNSYPYLYVGGMKQVGKTKLLTQLEKLCFNARFSTDITTSALFRSIENWRCTLLLDETENLANPERNLAMRSVLLSGNKKGGVVFRVNPNTLQVETFEVYSPKALANIKGIEDVLEDRCITHFMKRGKRREIIDKEIPIENKCWQEIRDMLYIFYLEYASELSELSECSELKKGGVFGKLSARELEIWRSILILALFFDRYFNGLFERVLEFAERKSEEKKTENLTETLDMILVKVLTSMVVNDGYYKVSDIRNAMAEYFDEPQKWLTSKWVGNALRRLGFAEKRRVGKGAEYNLTVKSVKDLAERLGIEIAETEPTTELVKGEAKEEELTKYKPVMNVPTIGEIEEQLRNELTYPFDDGKVIMLISKLRGCDPIEATKIFQKFVEEGKLAKDPYGYWEWTKGLSQSEPSGEKSKKDGIGMIECEICKAKGKQMHFFTLLDYCNHVNVCHHSETVETMVVDLTKVADRLFKS